MEQSRCNFQSNFHSRSLLSEQWLHMQRPNVSRISMTCIVIMINGPIKTRVYMCQEQTVDVVALLYSC